MQQDKQRIDKDNEHTLDDLCQQGKGWRGLYRSGFNAVIHKWE